MVVIGWFGFGEIPAVGTMLGVTLVVGSGLWLIFDEAVTQERRSSARA